MSIGRSSYGIGAAVLNLVRAQLTSGIDAEIWCLDEPAEIEWAKGYSGLGNEHIVGFKKRGPSFLGYSPDMERMAISSEREHIDVIHQQGIWSGISRVANLWREKYEAPTVIAPHGSLEQWALENAAWKKRVAMLAYQARNLREAACLHAMSKLEARGFREFGSQKPTAVIENGISDRWLQSEGDEAAFRSKYQIADDRRVMLYLGRISPVKNLCMLVKAMARIGDALQNWLLVIAGKDEFDYCAEVEATIRELHMEKQVRFVGSLYDEDKRNAFAAAEIFVLPSLRESSSLVVLESLGAVTPVLTTKGTPWQELETYHCGWWSDINVDAISAALYKATHLSREQLKTMGEQGRKLVTERYRWSLAARKCDLLYQWLLGYAEKPNFIVL